MDPLSFSDAATRIREGSVGVIPTDTLYGLVASALDPAAVVRVYGIRARETDKPCIVLFSGISDLGIFGIDPDNRTHELLSRVWPGPVSVVLPCSGAEWEYLHRGTGTIAFRVPKDDALHEFLVKAGPVIAPSANRAGEKPAVTAAEAEAYFGDHIDFVVDGGILGGVPSTVARIEQGEWVVLRQGSVPIPS
ncbi:MAG TPA: L-threonylcarbamoyladenylate synthase [Candidatus Fimivivens sp.]|nr:L-threonylcarbamoyladenylate synthase [Candidatus Fimivivens sp.]